MGFIPAADVPVDSANTCDQVDYRLSGIVQPHAALLVLSEPDLRVVQASRSTAELLGVAAGTLLGTAPFADGLLNPQEDLIPTLAAETLGEPRLVGTIDVAGAGPCTGRVHRSGNRLLLELEPLEHPHDVRPRRTDRLLPDLVEACAAATSLGDLLDDVVQCLRLHTGFDRVVVNRFDEDWHGEVVAEARHADLEPHLGIHFPKTDVPTSAREMLAAAPVRTTTDQFAEPSPLEPRHDPETGQDVDMTQVRCRAVGGFCQVYYRNMGVAATLVLPIMVRGRLWGLLAARHRTPRRVAPHLDVLLESVSRLVGISVARFQEEARADAERIAVDIHRSLSELTPEDPAWLTMLSTRLDTFRELLSADGLALVVGRETLTSGHLPAGLPISDVIAALTGSASGPVVASHRLGTSHPDLDLGGSDIAGALVVSLPSGDGDAALWLRRERCHTVRWAGRPEATEQWDAAGRPPLRPRASFAEWQQVTKSSSAPWSPDEQALAETAATQLGIQLVSHRALQASRSKTEFLANMSHELRTPLTAIMGFADLLRDDARDDGSLDAARTIRRNGEHLLGLINDILDLSKIESGRLDITPRPTDLEEVLRDVLDLLSIRAREGGIRLAIEWDGPVPATIRSDGIRLKQVLVNLVGNAIKFTQRGEVVIGTSWSPADAAGTADAADTANRADRADGADARDPGGGTLRIAVRDTGIGMSTEQLGRVFEPFEQADTSTTRDFGGTGLGLSISRRLAARLGGTLTATSTPGVGSCFTLALDTGPLDRTDLVRPGRDRQREFGTAPAPAEAEGGPILAGRSILVAEDGPDNQRLVAFHLRKAGARVELVEHGKLAMAALERARRHGRPFDVVLMDMQMPVLDGYATTRAMRADGDATPVIALTAHALEGDRERCLEAGCDAYLTKPIHRSSLVATIVDQLASRVPKTRTTAPAGTGLTAA